jgi:hypothetical protein
MKAGIKNETSVALIAKAPAQTADQLAGEL